MDYSAFFAYVFFMTFTPGPSNAMVMSIASKHGFVKTLRFMSGVILGLFTIFTASSIFASKLYELLPKIEPILLCIGSVYLLFLAWIIWRDKPEEEKKTIQAKGLISGLVLQLVNAKLYIFALSALTIFLLPNYKQLIDLFPFILIICLIGITASCSWALFGAILEKVLGKYKKVINLLLALFLVYCAISQLINFFREIL